MLLILSEGRPLLRLDEMAKLRNISTRTMQNHVYNKLCPFPTFKDGSIVCAHVSDVAAWIDREREAAKEEA